MPQQRQRGRGRRIPLQLSFQVLPKCVCVNVPPENKAKAPFFLLLSFRVKTEIIPKLGVPNRGPIEFFFWGSPEDSEHQNELALSDDHQPAQLLETRLAYVSR